MTRPSSCPELYFHMDIWHTIHLGAGRTFAASVIVLCSALFPGTSIPSRFEQLSYHYLQFCKENKRAPYLTRITQDKVNWKKPAGNWNKGAVTTNILYWLEALLTEFPNVAEDTVLDMCLRALQHLNRFLRMLYSCDAFIDGPLSQFLSNELRQFLQLYQGKLQPKPATIWLDAKSALPGSLCSALANPSHPVWCGRKPPYGVLPNG